MLRGLLVLYTNIAGERHDAFVDAGLHTDDMRVYQLVDPLSGSSWLHARVRGRGKDLGDPGANFNGQ